jgi:hypothetical protein
MGNSTAFHHSILRRCSFYSVGRTDPGLWLVRPTCSGMGLNSSTFSDLGSHRSTCPTGLWHLGSVVNHCPTCPTVLRHLGSMVNYRPTRSSLWYLKPVVSLCSTFSDLEPEHYCPRSGWSSAMGSFSSSAYLHTTVVESGPSPTSPTIRCRSAIWSISTIWRCSG